MSENKDTEEVVPEIKVEIESPKDNELQQCFCKEEHGCGGSKATGCCCSEIDSEGKTVSLERCRCSIRPNNDTSSGKRNNKIREEIKSASPSGNSSGKGSSIGSKILNLFTGKKD